MSRESEKVIADLNTLRNRHRLGLHMFEQDKPITFPAFSLGILNTVAAQDIPKRLAITGDLKIKDENAEDDDKQGMPLLSASLLLSQHSKRSITPYETFRNRVACMGYLVDLSTEQRNPPMVVAADIQGIASGNFPYNKHLKIFLSSSPLNHIYTNYPYDGLHSEGKWIKAVAEDTGGHLSEKQLNALGTQYESALLALHTFSSDSFKDGVVPFNEIIVAAAKNHIKGICVPLYNSFPAPIWYLPLMKLSGALAGLQHIEKAGIDVPVVFYHVTPQRDEDIPGTLAYLGKGKAELTKAAIEALEELNSKGVQNTAKFESTLEDAMIYDPKESYPLLKETVAELLPGIDIGTPLSEQKEVIESVLRNARCSLNKGAA